MILRDIACGMAVVLLLVGCGSSPAPVSGGTAGSLVAGDIPLPDFEIRVYQVGDSKPLGFGTSDATGKFRLVHSNGNEPLWLNAGEYAITLESIGPAAPQMLAAYADVSKTPLKVAWKTGDNSLDLKIPALKQSAANRR